MFSCTKLGLHMSLLADLANFSIMTVIILMSPGCSKNSASLGV